MSKRVCDYCREKYDASESRCPHCGGPNPQAGRKPTAAAAAQPAETPAKKRGVQKPKTIAELQDFAAAHNLPLSKMRVHIGEDYPDPKAFGIYQAEDGSFVVYKNKADGSRSIRYQGPDEAYAVNELYMKMKELVGSQKALQAEKARIRTTGASLYQRQSNSFLNRHPLLSIFLILFIVGVIVGTVKKRLNPQRGYYRFNDDYYYYQNNSWYYYDDESWRPVFADNELRKHFNDYYQSDSYSYSYGVDNFSNSSYYDPGSNGNHNDWNRNDDDDWDDWDDDDWDWGDDDWDDGGDDWDSDW